MSTPMPLDRAAANRYLRQGRFTDLFIEELGWDEAPTPALEVQVDADTYSLRPIAHKRGVMALALRQPALPPYALRRKIETQVARRYREHIIVFEGDDGEQVWQWVRREQGQPLQSREHSYRREQSGEALVQKLEYIRFSLEQEEDLSLVDVVGQVRAAFNVERATRRFFQDFKGQHDTFQRFLQGIPDRDLQSWYVSVMLNRLMFIYFIQKKGFLAGDPHYLRHKLEESERSGPDRYYREYLCPLFFEGFAKPESQRDPALRQQLGRVPYLDGGIFQRHQVEQVHGQQIHIPDQAFRRLFDFFDRYQWHLDDRPLRNDNEINPDVLGYIFEQYINQKQMGAYYTKEDITEYIGKNTIVPFLFDRARELYPAAFRGEGAPWALLQVDPDRYIYEAVRKGVDLPLPAEIEAGIHDVSQRGRWNTPTADAHALPTEIWRETVARRQRYEEIWLKLVGGEVQQINDLITFNLDIRQFVQDVIEQTMDPDMVRALWKAATGVTVLDPTCGSGAFLFAALNILKPIYEGCLDRMQQLIAELPPEAPVQTYRDFRETLAEIDRHPNREYFILKRIMVDNLYGVDIMEEATEIAKLRLFLKLVALVEDAGQLEPLPDIDFNIRAGNTLVGFTSLDDVERALRGAGTEQERLILLPEDEALLAEITEEAGHVDRLFDRFRQMQMAHDVREWSEDFVTTKEELRRRLGVLDDRLSRLLALQYGIDPDKLEYDPWVKSHQPFHWFVEFFGIMSRGGFDVVIGNPPYVEYRRIREDYRIQSDLYVTESCGNLYAYVMERCLNVLKKSGRQGMIIPHSSICTDRMSSIISLFILRTQLFLISTYDIRPSKLFVGVDQRLAIYLTIKGNNHAHNMIFSSKYHKWNEPIRPILLSLVQYIRVESIDYPNSVPKVSTEIERRIWSKMINQVSLRRHIMERSPLYTIYYHNSPRYWIRAMNFASYFWNERDGEKISTQVKSIGLSNSLDASATLCIINSSLFFWWFIILSDCRHLNMREIENFPVTLSNMSQETKKLLANLSVDLMSDLKRNARRREAYYTTTGRVIYDEFYPRYSKSIIDEIDRILAGYYGFTDEELDFIINYDIKYRMGDELLSDNAEDDQVEVE